ncbi:putative Nephrin-like 31, partial [Homarus americanus]
VLGEEVAGVPALVSVVVGASVGIVLLLLLLGLLVRQRVRRPPAPPPTSNPTHTMPPTTLPPTTLAPTTSPPPILKTSHGLPTHTCAHRQMQVEGETEVDPDLIPQQLVHSTLTPSGPLLRPPANYRGQDPSFCQVVVAGGGGGGGGGGGLTVHHHLLPATTTYTSPHHHHQQPAAAADPTSTPRHHPHPQEHYQHLVSDDPRYAHLDLEAGGRQVTSEGHRSRVVPTVYATLDTRRATSRETFDIRHSHSQASLDIGRGHDVVYSDDTRHDPAYHHLHDAARPLLEDDHPPNTITLVSKRESSV